MQDYTWLLIGAVVVLFARSHTKLSSLPTMKIPSPSAEHEVDPSRWAHDGSQPLWTQNGNQFHIIDDQAVSMHEIHPWL